MKATGEGDGEVGAGWGVGAKGRKMGASIIVSTTKLKLKQLTLLHIQSPTRNRTKKKYFLYRGSSSSLVPVAQFSASLTWTLHLHSFPKWQSFYFWVIRVLFLPLLPLHSPPLPLSLLAFPFLSSLLSPVMRREMKPHCQEESFKTSCPLNCSLEATNIHDFWSHMIWFLHRHMSSYLITSISMWERYNRPHFYSYGSTRWEKWNNLSKTTQQNQDRIRIWKQLSSGIWKLVWCLITFYCSFSPKCFFNRWLEWKMDCSHVNVNITTSVASLKLRLKFKSLNKHASY